MFKVLFVIILYGASVAADEGETHWFQSSALQKSLDEETRSRARTGNEVELLLDGVNSLKQRLDNVANADLILVKTFEFWDDISGAQILRALIDRAKMGAKVFIQYDVKGTFYESDSVTMTDLKDGIKSPVPEFMRKFLEESEGNGFLIPTSIPYSFFSSSAAILKDHEKYFITWTYKNGAEPVRAILGGMNIGDMYLLGGAKNAQGGFEKVEFYRSEGFSGTSAFPMRDADVQVIGPATEDVVNRYIQSWELQLQNPNAYFQKNLVSHVKEGLKELKSIQALMLQHAEKSFPVNIGDAYVRFVYKDARQYHSKSLKNISNLYRLMIGNMPNNSTVQLAAGMVLPTKQLWKEIYQAARRGVVFDILLDPPEGPESGMATIAMATRSQIRYFLQLKATRSEMRYFLKSMPQEKVNFYQWVANPAQGIGVNIHYKISSFGLGESDPCCIGSVNLNTMSFVWDSEDILVIQSPSFKRQVNQMFKNDLSPPNSEKINLNQLEKDSAAEEVKQFAINTFLRDFL